MPQIPRNYEIATSQGSRVALGGDAFMHAEFERLRSINGIMDKEEWHNQFDKDFKHVEHAATMKTNKEPVLLSVVFADLDNFGYVNKKLGHERGDELIEGYRKAAAESLRIGRSSSAPQESEGGRLFADRVSIDITNHADEPIGKLGIAGGDEILISAFTDEKGAEAIKERLRETTTAFFNDPSNADLQSIGFGGVGISIGTATYHSGMSKKELLKLADDAMRLDKTQRLPTPDVEREAFLREVIMRGEELGIPPQMIVKYAAKFALEESDVVLDITSQPDDIK